MPNDVIGRVRNLARRQAHANLGLDFTDRHRNPIIHGNDDNANDNNDESYRPDDDNDNTANESDDNIDDNDDDEYTHQMDGIPVEGVNDQNEINEENIDNNNDNE